MSGFPECESCRLQMALKSGKLAPHQSHGSIPSKLLYRRPEQILLLKKPAQPQQNPYRFIWLVPHRFSCLQMPNALVSLLTPRFPPYQSLGSALASRLCGCMSAKHSLRPPWLTPNAMCMLGASSSSCALVHLQFDSCH